MKTIIIDSKKQKTPLDVYILFENEFDFGPYFGRNTDALYDFMVPIDSEEAPLIIEWKNSVIFKEKYPTDFNNFIQVFERISKFEKDDKNIFQFLIE